PSTCPAPTARISSRSSGASPIAISSPTRRSPRPHASPAGVGTPQLTTTCQEHRGEREKREREGYIFKRIFSSSPVLPFSLSPVCSWGRLSLFGGSHRLPIAIPY